MGQFTDTMSHSETDAMSSHGSTIATVIAFLLGIAILGGVPVIEKFRYFQTHRKACLHEDQTYLNMCGLLYSVSFPIIIGLISSTVEMETKYRIYTWLLVAAPFVTCQAALIGPNISWTSAPAFGLRGSAIGLLATVGLLYILNQPGQELNFLSLASFAMAAWFCSALSSYGAWVAHPEYGNYGEESRAFLSAIQLCFVAGFGFQCAYLLNERAAQESAQLLAQQSAQLFAQQQSANNFAQQSAQLFVQQQSAQNFAQQHSAPDFVENFAHNFAASFAHDFAQDFGQESAKEYVRDFAENYAQEFAHDFVQDSYAEEHLS